MTNNDRLLQAFKIVVRILEDVEEEDCDWLNRLWCAREALAEFAGLLGRDFAAVAGYEHDSLIWLDGESEQIQ